ncbi:hypothetical protein BBJ29_008622 [Phytophthora kernoviae]|uniref:RxLR effector protein n=1 Tax=Phytophthora kernoviae TaxID=325452 RepID=A0A3F2RDB3_9STRA|nr:hypothetical protein BBP00_00009197 [Phytophthora kernoviae]RLN58038.1 hypothetical protein BBJ29_008622 [Phytophthora kernoviae]
MTARTVTYYMYLSAYPSSRSGFLLATATALLASSNAVSAARDVDHAALSKMSSLNPMDSVDSVQGNGNQFLRTSKAIEDDDDSEEDLEDDTKDDSDDEERGLLDVVKHASLKFIDDLAGDLVAVPGAVKYVTGENMEVFKAIAGKHATMTKAALKKDADYQL